MTTFGMPPSSFEKIVLVAPPHFLGLLRDSRTRLVEHTADSYRFCSTGAQGCDYIDARWTFSAADAYAFTIVNWSHFLKIGLEPYPALAAYQALAR